MLVIGMLQDRTQTSMLTSSEMGIGPIQDSGETQDIGEIANGRAQNGKHVTKELNQNQAKKKKEEEEVEVEDTGH